MISRNYVGKRRKPVLSVKQKAADGWEECDLTKASTRKLLPTRIVGYTSGDNETLSLPFLASRSGYAADVRDAALKKDVSGESIDETRLMLIDYQTNLEVLVANLLFGDEQQREAILSDARVTKLHSCRCIIELTNRGDTKEVKLTEELSRYLDHLKKCSTCYEINDKTQTYVFDFWINDETRKAFRTYWADALDLYRAFHKFAMLNDLAIKKKTREKFRKNIEDRHFATRLPEPPDDDKVFRFEQVQFTSRVDGSAVDYVSLSDGEHQLCQLLGMMLMQGSSGVLFLLDEPESHFNPQWRVKFISKFMELPTNSGHRGGSTPAAEQECLLTTHAPFVPSDMSRERVFVFSKEDERAVVKNPSIETYGTTFDTIIEECFDVVPPISERSRDELESLQKSEDIQELEEAIKRFGPSVEKALLVERLLQLRKAAEE
jgi:restriction system-associated AAA family ATPase